MILRPILELKLFIWLLKQSSDTFLVLSFGADYISCLAYLTRVDTSTRHQRAQQSIHIYIYRILVLQYCSVAFITRTMARPALKRTRKATTASRKRVKTSSSTAAAKAAVAS